MRKGIIDTRIYLSSTSGLLCLSTSWQGKFCEQTNKQMNEWMEAKWNENEMLGIRFEGKSKAKPEGT